MKMTVIGYARVSTDGQTLDSQQATLMAAGANRVFAEKISGAVTDRKALAKAIAALSARDVLLVTRLDRLAGSTRDLLNVLASISDKSAGFRSLVAAMALATAPFLDYNEMRSVISGLAMNEYLGLGLLVVAMSSYASFSAI